MAERRMVHKKISWSRQFNEMSEFAQLTFLMMIPHADDWGWMTGDGYVIKAQVLPMSDRNLEDIEGALAEMEEQSLIWRYDPDDGNGPAIQFCKWEEHQAGLSRRTKPKRKLYYYPDEAVKLLQDAGISWKFTEFHGSSPRTEQKGKELEQEQKGKERTEGNSHLSSKWRQVLIAMEGLHEPTAVRQQFAGTELVAINPSTVVIRFPNKANMGFVQDRLMQRLGEAIASVIPDAGEKEIKLEVRDG